MKILIFLIVSAPLWGQFRAAVSVVAGPGAPNAAQCTNANNVGRVWARKDGGATASTFYVCSASGVGTYAWELIGSASAPSGGAVGGASAVAAGQVLYGTAAGVAGSNADLAYTAASGRLKLGSPTGAGTTGSEDAYRLRINMGTAPGYGLSIANGAIDPWFHVNSNGIGFVGDGTTIPFWSIEDQAVFVRELRAHVVPAGGYSYLWAKSSDTATKPNDLQLWANRDIVLQAGRSNSSTDNTSRIIMQGSAGTTFTQWGSAGSNNSRTTIDYAGGARLYQYTSAGSLVNLFNAGGASYITGGNLLLGTTTDDGVNKLQVAGSGTFTQASVDSTFTIARTATNTASIILGAYSNAPVLRFSGSQPFSIGDTSGNGFFSVSTGGTVTVVNPIATTGSTSLVVRAGAGQAGNLQTWQNSAGTELGGVTSVGYVYGTALAIDGGVNGFFASNLDFKSTTLLSFSATTNATAAKDLTLSRSAAGILQVGTTAANASGMLYLKGTRNVASTVALLPAASGNAGMIATVSDATVTTLSTTVAGGGANTVLVWSNGTNWRIYAN